MAVAVRQSADPHWLLTQYAGAGFAPISQTIVLPVPVNADGTVSPHVQIDAFQWTDISAFGIGNTGNAVAQIKAQIEAQGSHLYAWAIFHQTNFDALGVKVETYRLVLLHSQVQLLAWAVAIVAAAFAAVIFIQYVTTGQSPAVNDLKSLWGSAVTSVGDAAGNVGQAIATPYLIATIASGAVLLVLARVGKESGVRAPKPSSPHGSISGKVGPATVKAST